MNQWLLGRMICLGIAGLSAGCGGYTVLTPEELTHLGTRQYDGCDVTRASERAAAAFETLGYKVTRLDKAGGVVKTAPKVVFVESNATSAHYRGLAQPETKTNISVQRDALAWVTRSSANGNGVTIVVRPRAYRDSVEKTHPGTFTKEFMDPHFQQVWREIQDELKTCH